MICSFVKPRRWILGAVIFMGFAVCAQAEDFTFNIPFELHNIHPNIKQGFVNVIVYTKDYVPTLQPNSLGVSSRVCYDSSGFEIVNGEYVGTLVVKMDALSKTVPGKRAQDAFYYEVQLVLNDSYYDNDTGGVRRMLDGTYGYDTSKPFEPIKRDRLPSIKR
jgi:hypothetical protein